MPIDTSKYKVTIWWSEDDHAFLAAMPELPGCMADGPTQAAALEEIQVVARGWIEFATELGHDIPLPQAPCEKRSGMKFTYGAQADAMRCYWGEPAGVAVSDEVADDLILDYDAEGRVIGVEILSAKERIKYLGPQRGIDLLEP